MGLIKSRIVLLTTLALALTLPVALMTACRSHQQSTTQAGRGGHGAPGRPEGPCDIYAAGGTPCVAAHSTTRALYASYNGPLYQVVRQSDGKTKDIGVVQPSAKDAGGYADAAAQDAFCAGTICFIKLIYDQSGKGNHLYQAPPGTFKGPAKGAFNTLPIADMAPITIGGHKAYGVYIMPGMGFRNNNASGTAINDEPEGVYSVMDGTHYDSGCCFDYGNAETDSRADGPGTMETTYFGTATAWGTGDGPGPWIEADFEGGVFSGYNAKKNAGSPTIDSWRFVTAVVDGGGGNKWDLRGGNAQQGGLTTFYSGARPGSSNNANYFPMHKQGAVLLGSGGDNGNGSSGTFYEGVMTTGYPTEVTTDALQTNIVTAKYDVQQAGLTRVTTFTPRSSQDTTVTFKNITGAPVSGLKLSLSLPAGWTAVVSGAAGNIKTFTEPVAPGASVKATFKVTSPARTGTGFLTGIAEWTGQSATVTRSETTPQRVRNAFPIKINEVRLNNQFIELYNASESEVDLSNWTLINTPSQWAPVKAGDDPGRDEDRPSRFLPARPVQLRTGRSRKPGRDHHPCPQHHRFRGRPENRHRRRDPHHRQPRHASRGHDYAFHSSLHGAMVDVPRRLTNLPVTSATGFEVGQKIGIDIGGNFEAGHGDRGRQAGHADDAVRGGGRGRDQYQGRCQRRHDRR